MSDTTQRAAEVVKSALERSPSEWPTFLEEACGNNARMRAEVDSLLQFQREAHHFIEQGALHVAAQSLARAPAPPFPQQIEGYQILSRIGVGGMGEVFLAQEMKLRRKVALKLVRAGMDSAEIVARFRHEEQILASLNHPNIAQLYGAGVAAGDIPFFAMEFIDGVRIDEYCNSKALSPSARLEIFRKVCAAVHYAHQRLIIHRDLKPSNILVTADGEPKLLDFGIAKLIEGQDAFTQMQTLPGAMTPDYASPEQVRGEAMTTSTDVYSLGVLLYEILTGQRPYRLKTRSPDEIARAITDQEPERPSTVIARGDISTLDIRPSAFPKGDLDNVVLMALRKEPQRRYASVGQFSEDLRRYLEGLPVIAHKDTVSYRATKFIKRHKIGMAAAALVLLTLVGGIVATAWQAKRATAQAKIASEQARVAAQERDRAQKEAAKSERINSFLRNILGFSDPSWLSSNPRRNREPTIAEALEEAGRRAEKDLADQPEVLASVRFVIGQTYLSQRRLEAAELHLRAAYDLRRNVLGPESQETAQSMATLAELCLWQGKYAEAELLSRDALATFRRAREAGNVNVLWMTYALTIAGGTEITMGRAAAGEAILREALEVGHSLSGADRAPLNVIYSSLSVARSDQGDVDGAIGYLEKSLDEQRRVSNEPRMELAIGLSNLGNLLALKGDYGRAESLLIESIEIHSKSVGEAHQNTAYAIINLANVYCLRGDYRQAREEIDRAMRIQQQVLAEGHIDFARSWIVLGRILTSTGEPAAGEPYLRRALELRTRALKPGHWRIAETQGALGECLMAQNRRDEAEPLLLESHEVMQEKFGAKDPRTKEARIRLVALYEAWGKPELAVGYRPE
jgi:serine/threonine-protein kinase